MIEIMASGGRNPFKRVCKVCHSTDKCCQRDPELAHIFKDAKGQEKVHLSAEDVTSCCHSGDMGCNGGIPFTVCSYYQSTGIVDGGKLKCVGRGLTTVSLGSVPQQCARVSTAYLSNNRLRSLAQRAFFVGSVIQNHRATAERARGVRIQRTG